MLKINFLTIFPKYFDCFLKESIIGKAIERKKISINVIDFREFSENKHKKVDDSVYGGGQGMLLQVQPIAKALKTLKGLKILVSPQGKLFNQEIAKEIVKNHSEITFVSGRYEGFDERILNYIDIELSIGDYILTGGELPSMVMADSIIRLWEDVIKKESYENESFENNLLDYPQYTRPRVFEGFEVPEILLNGNHKEIEKWRKQKQIEKTKINRPDLYERFKNEK
ncbi:TRNA (GUANINE-N1)-METHYLTRANSFERASE (M1G-METHYLTRANSFERASE) (TRNA [GM37] METHYLTRANSFERASE) [Mycoplasmopsis pulmonis]|uniref:tRNA (guanine-N(1)-)-methyltransferase n=1 Tax=Mycoplasmopsis pulmonis (strain UAB CTIP) TaxID=272635 RepID=TRMD_MYCPU|nr:tRNA (guanosine(37)-N1)-methyltransferase TrmD [Mycoplasmopsis pulmonis]Q98Q98.1 RecName: Full=tRNA (guanine-N(1)-)-methyltransferase; AltName: Full=M1G-methyltransferase; AltName: Full=tRNA [GM37] methyltransferase [Mycoplasmopsis pulmonis UAB CTIP]MDZ7293523.1 tRNA (guanosine(37)-N1)-methyltransferase TrmD [Mycoplasmopsis pulmonis]CAC13641.1 TRNA (GUANINE-N1)-METHYLTRANSFERASE (M1G-METHYLTRANSFERASE) (TRNA [GM37] METHYLTRANSFERASE) [Mycoplasmopsis pulmonis]VEU68232.1 tRNA (guanine-N(1)-)-m